MNGSAQAWSIGKLAPALALGLLIGSIGLGLVFVVALGLGYLPALGGEQLSTEPIRLLLGDPRLPAALSSTLLAGWVATIAATMTGFALIAVLEHGGAGLPPAAQRLATIVMAVPHVTLALGLAFVLAPSGWLMRGLAALTGAWPQPPDWTLVPVDRGWSLALILYLKETPFLLFAMAMAMRQLQPAAMFATARTLGYSDGMAWIKLVLPRLYPLVRFPIFAVLAYSLSVADMSLILGPTTPPTLPVLVLTWSRDPDLNQRFVAAAGALLQVALVAGALGAWWLGERIVIAAARPWISAGRRRWPVCGARVTRWLTYGIAFAGVALAALSIAALLLWSVAEAWRYPALLPDGISFAAWRRGVADLGQPLLNSVLLAVASTAIAIALSLACLQHERLLRTEAVRAAEPWLFLPLLVPEISFLFGLQILLLLIGLNGTWLAILWMHQLFVFPYVFLTLKEPWRAFDGRYETAALALGRSPWQVLWYVKVPMLRAPLAWASAIGATVSLSLYLPTIQGGEGRVATLVTEAVAMAAGGDRRLTGTVGITQAAIAGLMFGLALWLARVRRWRAA